MGDHRNTFRQNQSYHGVSKIAAGAVSSRKTALGSNGLPYSNSDFALALKVPQNADVLAHVEPEQELLDPSFKR
jgi:hypothetical protein